MDWMLFVVLLNLIFGSTSNPIQSSLLPSNYLQCGSVVGFTVHYNSDGRVILTYDDDIDIVFLSGEKTRSETISRDMSLDYSLGLLVSNVRPVSGEFQQFSVYSTSDEVRVYNSSTSLIRVEGPGILYTSNKLAFFTDNDCVIDSIAQVLSELPAVVSNEQLESSSGELPSPTVVPVQVQVKPQVSSEGKNKTVLVVNDLFVMTLTGASTMRLDMGQTRAISYSSEILTIISGDGRGESTFPTISKFATVQVVAGAVEPEPQLIIYSSTDDIILYGACQIHVNLKEKVSFYVQNFIPQAGNNVADIINEEVFRQVFRIKVIGGEATVTDIRNSTLISVTSSTRRFELPSAEEVIYYGDENFLVVRNRDSNSINVSGIHTFSIYRNNELQVFKSHLNVGRVNITLSNGGVLYVNDTEGTALFTSSSNPAVSQQIDGAATAASGEYTYVIDTDSTALYILVATRQNDTEVSEVVLVLTGAEVIDIESLQTLTYINDEIIIRGTDGTLLTRLALIGHLVVNSGSTSLASYTGFSAAPFSGPGTLIVNRGTGFFTTDQTLGESLSTTVAIAPLPVVHFETIRTGSNVVDGITHTVAAVIQSIGGDIVAVYEAESYDVSEEQVIVYHSGLVTVHRSISVSSEGLSYIGSQRIVTYTNIDGDTKILTDVETLHVFSGGDVEMFASTDNFSLSEPGKIFVSGSGEVLFTTSMILTSDTADLIRRLVLADFSASADQFSSISSGVFQLSTTSALVIYTGGGTIWQSASNGTTYSLYINDESLRTKTIQAVSTRLGITKSAPPKDLGILRIIFNGRDIYSYLVIPGNSDIVISRTDSFSFNGTTIFGSPLIRASHDGIDEVIRFDGIEVKVFESTTTPVVFTGLGLLLVQSASGTAFYTTWTATVNYILQAIAILQQSILPPRIERPNTQNVKTNSRFVTVMFGTNVRAFEGANISFVCNVIASVPPPNISIFRVGSNRVLSLITSSNDSMDNTLEIADISGTDSGDYLCRVDNGVPPVAEETSRLVVREAVAPVLMPGWFPFVPNSGQHIFRPTLQPNMRTFNIQLVTDLLFLCRVDGRPSAEVLWKLNNIDINTALGSGVNITEVSQGRSILSIDVEANKDILRGDNMVECSAENTGGSTSGSVVIRGIFYSCVHIGNGTCSRTCGIGVQEREFECTKIQAEMISETVSVDEVPEAILPKEQRSQICTQIDSFSNPIICPLTEYRWNTSEWSECSRTCSVGSRTRNVTCLSVSIPLTSQYQAQLDAAVETVVDENLCIMVSGAGERPTGRELCMQQTCPIWQTSQYSECSVSCGSGVAVRSVTCNILTGQFRDMAGKIQHNLTIVNETLCSQEDRPVDTRPCNRGRCPYEWRLGQFKECGDVPLSEEFRFCKQREVFCYNTDPNLVTGTRQVPSALCADEKQPISLASCGGGRCFNGIWEALSWSQCTESCGYGMQSRVVQCRSPLSLTAVAIEFCDSATMPYTTSSCFVRNCENTCLRDESPLCPILASNRMCGSPFAMGDDGLRCCVSCMGMGGGD